MILLIKKIKISILFCQSKMPQNYKITKESLVAYAKLRSLLRQAIG